MTVRNRASQRVAPGMRVQIRDEEWRVRRTDRSSDGGYILTCEGLSELVQGREAQFLDRLEQVQVLAPESTELVDDTSSNFDASFLYLSALLRRSAAADDRIIIGHQAALDQLPFQFVPAVQALRQPRQRILIADSVGLGKTLEAGILASELIVRGRGKRILVLATKAMLSQFQQEFWNRFTIPLTRLDSVGLQRVRNRIPANHNPFHYFDRSIISIDTLKQDIEYRHYLERAYWDIIIIDEAHNVAERGTASQRARLAKLLATRSDTLIMLSATPHDGKPESFASLMNMLDPTAIVDPKDYTNEDFSEKGLVVRRFKHDIRDQLGGNFPDREIATVEVAATEAEEAVYDQLANITFHTLDGGRAGSGHLLRTTLEKALFSSPAACLSTVQNRIRNLTNRVKNVRDEEQQTAMFDDIDTLEALQAGLERITPSEFSKYQKLLDLVGGELGWKPNQPDDRLVIFTESVPTLKFLAKHLGKDAGIPAKAIAEARGDMSDRELMDTIERFNRKESDYRVLLCTDVASEGLNLHYQSHRMIHFDIPWSLMVFQQRNGRIDRYGQTKQPQIRYLQTISANPEIHGDQRVLQILIEKDEMAMKNIGDPSEFLLARDQQEQEDVVREFIESDTNKSTVGFDAFLASIGGVDETQNPVENFTPTEQIEPVLGNGDLPTLFANELDYAKAGLRWLREQGEHIEGGVTDDVFWMQPTRDLEQRLKLLPSQIRPENNEFQLTNNLQRFDDELRRIRADEEEVWMQIHWLWPMHPVMEWLTDRALHAFGRHTAPVLRLPDALQPDEHIVLIHGGFPNRRGYTLLQDWVAVRFKGKWIQETLAWNELQERLQLAPGTLPNRGVAGPIGDLRGLLPSAVDAAQSHLRETYKAFAEHRGKELERLTTALEDLRNRHLQQIELEYERSKQFEAVKESQRSRRTREVEDVFADHMEWLENTQEVQNRPYLQIAAVFTGQEA